jgi:hypothetical protein
MLSPISPVWCLQAPYLLTGSIQIRVVILQLALSLWMSTKARYEVISSSERSNAARGCPNLAHLPFESFRTRVFGFAHNVRNGPERAEDAWWLMCGITLT